MLEKVSSARIPIRPPAISRAIRLLEVALMPRRSCGICDSGMATNRRSVASVFGKSVRSLNSMCAVKQVMRAFPHVRNGYREIRKFRRDFLRLLTQVKAAYPEARLSDDRRGIALTASPPPAPKLVIRIPRCPSPSRGKIEDSY